VDKCQDTSNLNLQGSDPWDKVTPKAAMDSSSSSHSNKLNKHRDISKATMAVSRDLALRSGRELLVRPQA
jgi:hypothetical protein